MDAQRLTSMANQIAAFFRRQGDDAAVAGVEDHMRKYWDPRMRRQVVDHLRSGGDGLDPLVRRAVERLSP